MPLPALSPFVPPFARDIVSRPYSEADLSSSQKYSGRFGDRPGPPFGFERRAIHREPVKVSEQSQEPQLQPVTDDEIAEIVGRILRGEPPKVAPSTLMLVAGAHQHDEDAAEKIDMRPKRRGRPRPGKSSAKLQLPDPKTAGREIRLRMEALERAVAQHEAAQAQNDTEAEAKAAALVEEARQSLRRAQRSGRNIRSVLAVARGEAVEEEDEPAPPAVEPAAAAEPAPAPQQRGWFGRLLGNHDGNAAIEFAFVAPALILAVLGGLNYGMAMLDLTEMRYATEAAARCYGLGQCDESSAVSYAQNQSPTVQASYTADKESCGGKVSGSYTFSLITMFPSLTLKATACYPLTNP